MNILEVIINKIEKLDRSVNNISEIIIIYAFVITLLLISAQVTLRYVFNLGVFWFSELARYLLVLFSFLAGSVALRRNELIGMGLLEHILPAKFNRWINLVGIILNIFFCAFATFYGFKVTISILQSGQPSPSMRIPIGLAYLPIPISMFLMLLTLLITAYNILFKYKTDE